MSYTVERDGIRIHVDPDEAAIAAENDEYCARGKMMMRGGMTMQELMNVLVMRGHLIRIESFGREVNSLLKEENGSALRKRIPKVGYLENWCDIGLVFVGNEREEAPWWNPFIQPVIEERPDLVIERLAREGSFESLVICDS